MDARTGALWGEKMKIVFCKIGWSSSYNGDISDKPVNGGSYNVNQIGHEIHNFKSFNGTYYGYVQSTKDNIEVSRIDRNAKEKAENVLVIWCATREKTRGQVIIGWYKNATIYREHQFVPDDVMEERNLKDHNFYNIISNDVFLIPENERKFEIDYKGRNVWYAEEKETLKQKVLEYIKNYSQIYNNRIIDIEKNLSDLSGEEKEAIVKVRINQDKFRKSLLDKYKKCCLCGVQCTDFLIASHLKPWCTSDKKEKLDIGNGLLLCPNHDKLLDKGFISFDENGKILISDKINENDRIFLNINPNMKIEITEDNAYYVSYHRKHIYKK